MESIPFYIDETGGLSIAQLAARARRLKRQKGLDLIIVDYIQLLQGSSRKAAEGRVQEVTEITTTLKALAKELNVPIVALSQLSRQVEKPFSDSFSYRRLSTDEFLNGHRRTQFRRHDCGNKPANSRSHWAPSNSRSY